MSDDDAAAITALLQETGRAHHQAFLEVDGVDPEWPLWYAQHLHPRLRRADGEALTVSDLVHTLVEASRAASAEPWSELYAVRLIAAGSVLA